MRPFFKASILSFLLLFSAFAGWAAEATTSAATTASSFNPMLIALTTLIVVLLFAIAVLGNVLSQLAVIYRDKLRADRNKKPIIPTLLFLVAFTLPALQSFAQEAAEATDAATAVVQSSPFISGIPKNEFYALMAVIVLQLLIVFSMIIYMRILLKAISAKPELAAKAQEIVKKVPFWDRFHAVVPLDKEEDITLDHDYDGIKELDNSLPPWWKYGFYFTILVSFVYIWYYHGGGNGPSSEQEYIAAVQKGEEAKAAYLAKTSGNIDETNVKMADAAGLAEGKLIYEKNCGACHAADGGGSVGPNLADEYWIHGGSLPDIFKSIKYGWQDKGMKPWKDDFSPKQLASLSSFVKSLQGTKPAAPKEKQGELYVEGSAKPATDTAQKSIAIQ
ncbi:MAG TPA: cbb3-type cytochrome c oxidase N-terminal domain-containing protein [Flavipsychrobacter sp.]|nr:cbb3-type cytochrome c oxidase N-terminal domain-containing protein [Flavipsychrobacter sp.]